MDLNNIYADPKAYQQAVEENERLKTLLKSLKAFAMLALYLAAAAVNVSVMVKFWDWFLVPLGIVQASVPQILGLCYFGRMVFYHTTYERPKKKPEQEDQYTWESGLKTLFFWASTWLLGWLLHLLAR